MVHYDAALFMPFDELDKQSWLLLFEQQAIKTHVVIFHTCIHRNETIMYSSKITFYQIYLKTCSKEIGFIVCKVSNNLKF